MEKIWKTKLFIRKVIVIENLLECTPENSFALRNKYCMKNQLTTSKYSWSSVVSQQRGFLNLSRF